MARRCKDCGTEAMPRDNACVRCGTPLPASLSSLIGGWFQKSDAPHVGLAPKRNPQFDPSNRTEPRTKAKAVVSSPEGMPPATDAWGLPLDAEQRPQAAWPEATPADESWGDASKDLPATQDLGDDAAALETKLKEMAQKPEPLDGERPGRSRPSTEQGVANPKIGLSLDEVWTQRLKNSPLMGEQGQKAAPVALAFARILKGEPAWDDMKPWAPSLASLWWPGLGQVLQGRLKSGLFWWVGSMVLAMVITSVLPVLVSGIPLPVALTWSRVLYGAVAAWEAFAYGNNAKG